MMSMFMVAVMMKKSVLVVTITKMTASVFG